MKYAEQITGHQAWCQYPLSHIQKAPSGGSLLRLASISVFLRGDDLLHGAHRLWFARRWRQALHSVSGRDVYVDANPEANSVTHAASSSHSIAVIHLLHMPRVAVVNVALNERS